MPRSLRTALFLACISAYLHDDTATGAFALYEETSRDVSVGEGHVRRALTPTTNHPSRVSGAELRISSHQQQVVNKSDRHLLASEAPSVARLLAVNPRKNPTVPSGPTCSPNYHVPFRP